jgi:hypothetical protein
MHSTDWHILFTIRKNLTHYPTSWCQNIVNQTYLLDGTSCMARCIVGWVVVFTEPTLNVREWSPTGIRVLTALYQALPKSSRRCRAGTPTNIVLGRYNDTHKLPAIIALVDRALRNLENKSPETGAVNARETG